MNLAELKSAWNEYDDKLKTVHSINDKIILSMIRERSKSRLSRIGNRYKLSFILNTIWILIIIAALLTNPFDFTHPVQYIPIATLGLCLVIFTGISVKSYRELLAVDIHSLSLEDSLTKIIRIFEKSWNLHVQLGAQVGTASHQYWKITVPPELLHLERVGIRRSSRL